MSGSPKRRKKASSSEASGLASRFGWLKGGGRSVALLILIVALALAGWYVVWHDVKSHVLASDDYWLHLTDVQMTPLPPWIHTDVRAEVFRNASLDEPLSIMQSDLSRRLADAFALHPWVARVEEIRVSHPARAEVVLEYRRPVLMVEVSGGLLPVDRNGVLLPSGDFSPVEASRYPRLVGVQTYPLGPIGTPWGDNRVVAAAEIADALAEDWHALGLERISPNDNGRSPLSRGKPTTYELITRGGTHVFWGRAPSEATPGSVPVADKIARLKRYAEDHGSLEGSRGPQRIDLTAPDRVRVTRIDEGPQEALR
jgi:hypothetical protein